VPRGLAARRCRPQYEAALRLDPAYSLAHNNSATFVCGRRVDEARREYEAPWLGPRNAEAHNNLARRSSLQPGCRGDSAVTRAIALRPIYPKRTSIWRAPTHPPVNSSGDRAAAAADTQRRCGQDRSARARSRAAADLRAAAKR